MEKIKVVAYCRVSTDSRQQASSYENQVEYFNRELSRNPELEMVGIYADKGISGTKLRRTEFDKMLYDAGLDFRTITNDKEDTRKNMVKYITIPSAKRQPKFNRIYVKDTSRFARNAKVEDILDDLAKNQVYVYFMDYGISTENEADRSRLRIFFDIAEQESRLKSKKTKWGFDESIRRGTKIHTSGKLYGYVYNQPENRLEIREDEAEVVRLIYNLYAEGMGIRRIANVLDERGIKTRNGESFCKSSLMRILTNEKYIGVSNRGKYDTGLIFINKNSYPKVKDEYNLTDTDKIPPIITPELFQQCQDILSGRTTGTKGIYHAESEYANFIQCKICGKPYYSNYYLDNRGKSPREYYYYMCSTRKTRGKKACNSPIIKKQYIDNIVQNLTEHLDVFIENERNLTLETLDKVLYALMEKLSIDNSSTIMELNAEIERLNQRRDGLVELFLSSQVRMKDSIKNQIASTEQQIEDAQQMLDVLLTPNRVYLEQIKETLDSITKIKNMELEIKPVYTKKEVMEFVKSITISRLNIDGQEYNHLVHTYDIQQRSKLWDCINTFGLVLRDIPEYTNEQKEYLVSIYKDIMNLSGKD